MSQQDNVDALCQLSTRITEKERKIWEFQTRNQCIKEETERLNREIKHINKRTAELEKEDVKLETITGQLSQSIQRQQISASISNNSLVYHKLLKRRLSQEAKEFKSKYSAVLAAYNEELQICRQKYESTSTTFKLLRSNQVEVKKLEFQSLWLKAQIGEYERIYKTFEEIQRKIFQVTIVKFTKTYLAYKEIQGFKMVLQEMKEEQKQLLKEHWELQNEVKELSNKQTNAKNLVKPRGGVAENNKHTSKQLEEELMPPQVEIMESESSDDVGQLFSQKFHAFINEGFQPLPLTTIIPTTGEQFHKFNKSNSKVRILDVNVVTKMENKPLRKNEFVKIKTTSEVPKLFQPSSEVTLNHKLNKNSQKMISEKKQFASTSGLHSGLERMLKQVPITFKGKSAFKSSQEKMLETKNETPRVLSQDQSKVSSLKEGNTFRLSQDNSKVLQLSGNNQEESVLSQGTYEKSLSQERELMNFAEELNSKTPSMKSKQFSNQELGNETISKFFDNKTFVKKSVTFQDIQPSNLEKKTLRDNQNDKVNKEMEEEKVKKTVTFNNNIFKFLATENPQDSSYSEKEMMENSINGSSFFKSPDIITSTENATNEDLPEAFTEDNFMFASDFRNQPAEDKSESQTFKTFSFGKQNKDNVFSMF